MFVVAGDTHLAPHAWSTMPQVCGDSYRSFEQLVDFSIEKKVSALLLAGDVFDVRPNAQTASFFVHQMLKLEKENIPVYAIQGQHARDRELPWTSVYPWVVHLEHQHIELEPGIIATGFDNLTPDELKTELSKLRPDVNVLILHQMCRGTVPEIPGRQNWDLDPDWVPPTVKLVIMGDYHEPWSTSLVRDGFVTNFVYTGSTCMQSCNEPTEKRFLMVDSQFNTITCRLNTRPFRKIVILSETQMPGALVEVEKLPADALCQLRFDPRIPAVEQRIRTAAPKVHFKVEPLSITNEGSSDDRTEIGMVSLESCLDQIVDRSADSELHSFVMGLLKNESTKDFLVAEKRKRVDTLEAV